MATRRTGEMANRQQVRAEQKRRARQRTGQLYEDLRQILALLRTQGESDEEDVRVTDRNDILKQAIMLIQFAQASDAGAATSTSTTASTTSFAGVGLSQSEIMGEAITASQFLGTMLVRTSDLVVLHASQALDNLWMITDDQRSMSDIVHQSLWSIVHWNDHEEMAGIQGRLMRRDRSVVGTCLRALLIRMTRSGSIGLAKFVRRSLQVLHLSGDGATALLSIAVEEDDQKALQIGEKGLRFWNQGIHSLRIGFDRFSSTWQSGNAGSKTELASSAYKLGLSFVDFEKVAAIMSKFKPEIYMIAGRDSDGVSREMGFSRIFLPDSQDMSLASSYFVPLFNTRIGEEKLGDLNFDIHGNAYRDVAIKWWVIPVDDSDTWRFNAGAGMAGMPGPGKLIYHNYLLSFLSRQEASRGPGSCVGYFNTTMRGCLGCTRNPRQAHGFEGRPTFKHLLPDAGPVEVKSAAVDQELARLFQSWEGHQQYFDAGDAPAGVWHEIGEHLCEIFGG